MYCGSSAVLIGRRPGAAAWHKSMELLDKLAAHRKKLMRNRLFIRVLPLIHNNRHINLRTEPEQFSKHTDLHLSLIHI